MVPKDCYALPEIEIRDNMDKTEVMEQLKETGNPSPQLADVVKYMRTVSFSLCLDTISLLISYSYTK